MNIIRGRKLDIARQIIAIAADLGKGATMSNGQKISVEVLAASHTLPELRRAFVKLMNKEL